MRARASAGKRAGRDGSSSQRARTSAHEAGITNLDLQLGFAERLPVEDSWADVVISNGVMNLFPDKLAGLQEMSRVLKPGGRLQIGDIIVSKAVSPPPRARARRWR